MGSAMVCAGIALLVAPSCTMEHNTGNDLNIYYFREATISKLEGRGFKNNYEWGGGWGQCTKFCIPISFCNL